MPFSKEVFAEPPPSDVLLLLGMVKEGLPVQVTGLRADPK